MQRSVLRLPFLNFAAKELTNERRIRAELERKLALSERVQLQMQTFINTAKKLETTQVIYVGTTRAYQRQNRFKVGGCLSAGSLSGRFSGYNSGRPADDLFFCVKYWNVHSYRLIESIAKTLLVNFKDNQNKKGEDYHINGTALILALDYIIETSEENVKWFNNKLEDFVEQTVHSKPAQFAPLKINRGGPAP